MGTILGSQSLLIPWACSSSFWHLGHPYRDEGVPSTSGDHHPDPFLGSEQGSRESPSLKLPSHPIGRETEAQRAQGQRFLRQLPVELGLEPRAPGFHLRQGWLIK